MLLTGITFQCLCPEDALFTSLKYKMIHDLFKNFIFFLHSLGRQDLFLSSLFYLAELIQKPLYAI